MSRIACIVEGQGDVQSIPIILRRIAQSENVYDPALLGPIACPVRPCCARERSKELSIGRPGAWVGPAACLS